MRNKYGRPGRRIVCILGVGMTLLACSEANTADKTTPELAVDAAMAEMKSLPEGAVLGALQTLFPEDYARLRGDVLTNMKNSASEDEAYEAGLRWVKTFVSTHAADASRAPDEVLVRWLEANVALLTALREENVQACADAGARSKIVSANLSAPTRARVGAVGVRLTEAIRAGLDHPVSRPATLSGADEAAFGQAMGQLGVTQEMFLTIAQDPSRPPALECEFSIALYKAPTLLPKDQAGRLASLMLANSGPKPPAQ